MLLRRHFALRLQRAKSVFADWAPAHAVPALNLVKGGLRLLLVQIYLPHCGIGDCPLKLAHRGEVC
ncbi:MAG: hypothetical protein D8M54_18620 [Chloroflexi bacterium]|nr:hypothetical protein [Chloroflexota bacterium]